MRILLFEPEGVFRVETVPRVSEPVWWSDDCIGSPGSSGRKGSAMDSAENDVAALV